MTRQQNILIFIVIYTALSLLPFFDYNQLLLPHANDVAMMCHLVDIGTQHNITETSVGYLMYDEIKLFLYTTTIIRQMSCHYRFTGDESPRLFIYSDIYLNVTHTDLNRIIAETRASMTNPKELWLYDENDINAHLLRDTELDRFGFAVAPADREKDFWNIFLIVKFLLLFPTGILVSCLYLVFVRDRMSPMRPV
jgi:hypothetical protein